MHPEATVSGASKKKRKSKNNQAINNHLQMGIVRAVF